MDLMVCSSNNYLYLRALVCVYNENIIIKSYTNYYMNEILKNFIIITILNLYNFKSEYIIEFFYRYIITKNQVKLHNKIYDNGKIYRYGNISIFFF